MEKDTISLKQYIEQRFDAADKALIAALASQKEAILKAEIATEKRFESVNEFRATLADQQRDLMPRKEAELKNDDFGRRLKLLEDAKIEKTAQGQGVTSGWGYAVGAVGLVIGIIGFIMGFKQ